MAEADSVVGTEGVAKAREAGAAGIVDEDVWGVGVAES